MDEIKDLIKIVTDHTKRNLPLLDLKNQHNNGNKEMNLFLGLKNGEFNSDLEASNGIYGSEEVDFKFRMLKSRLNRKLLNHLFFMDFDSRTHDRPTNFYQEALDYLHFSKMLLNINETNLGTKTLHKTIDLAKACEYTSIVIESLRILREVYAKTYRPKLFQNIKRSIKKFEALQLVEEEADAIFQEHMLSLNSTVNNRKRSLTPYKKVISQLKELYTKTNSYNIFERYLKMNIWYYELKGDFEQVLKIIEDVEVRFEKGLINQKRFSTIFIHTAKGNALIKTKKFEEGSLFLSQMLKEIDQTSKTWFSFAEQFVILNIQNRQYDKAADIFIKVACNRSFSNLNEKEILKWNIFRSYLYFLTGNKKIIRKFDYQGFIENIPEFEKENAGYNVAILILQFISHLHAKFDFLHDNLNALDDYVNKYLNNSYSKRTKTFCKLLHKVVILNRNAEKVYSKSKYLQERLHESQIAGNSFVDFEVVPYEYLWEHVLTELKN